MRILTTVLNQMLCIMIWLYFTHHFLIKRENNFKREAVIFIFYILWALLTATVLWYDTELKSLISPVFLYLSFAYIYKHDMKRFIITLLYIFIGIFLSELFGILLFIMVFQKPLEALGWLENLIVMPPALLFNFWLANIILKSKGLISALPNISLLFVFSQVPIMLMIDLSYQQHSPGSLTLPAFLIFLFTVIAQLFLWKKKDSYFNAKKEQMIHKQLRTVYEHEMEAYFKQRDQLQVQRKLRHDLLNEIQVISYMEQQ